MGEKRAINLIIPAAGAATRLRPFTNNTSKIMVRVNGKPCIDYILDQLSTYEDIEVHTTVIVRGVLSDIQEYCERRYPKKNIIFAKQESLDGPRDAIKIGFDRLETTDDYDKNLPVVVWLGDAIILEESLPLGTDFLLCKKDVDDHQNWCMWESSTNEFYNKPAHKIPNGVALVGLYSFADGAKAADAFCTIDSYDISDALGVYNHHFDKVITDQWYDIGDITSYHDTCAKLLHQKTRAFNRLVYDNELSTLTKYPDFMLESSKNTLRSEIKWYKNLSKTQRCFVPNIIDDDVYSFTMSYESGTLLSDIMLYEDVSESMWDYIMTKLFRIKTKYFSERFSGDDHDVFSDGGFLENAIDMWKTKTSTRLEQVSKSGLLLTETKEKLLLLVDDFVTRLYPIQCMHGDFHFGNVIYNYHSDQLTFIDPRGQYGSSKEGSTIGDNLYDWAKLSHDLIHGYNAMVSDVPHNEMVKALFLKKLKEYNLPVNDIVNSGLVLLASCIPLHYDNPYRQQRFASYVNKTINEMS